MGVCFFPVVFVCLFVFNWSVTSLVIVLFSFSISSWVSFCVSRNLSILSGFSNCLALINCFYFCKSVNNIPTLTPEFINLTPFSHCNIVLSILLTFSENQFLASWFLCFSVLYLIYLCSNLFYFLSPSSCVFSLLLCFYPLRQKRLGWDFCVCVIIYSCKIPFKHCFLKNIF